MGAEISNGVRYICKEKSFMHIDGYRPSKNFEPTPNLPKAIETPEAGLDDDILEGVGFDEIIHVVEQDMFPIDADTHTTTGNMEDNVEDLDDIYQGDRRRIAT
ncbi:hypothetical protein POM88_041461 [Heracleum sosnowskyi]|uniref:Uncharacterized protein n=1 Tax=Heracleum sosnowskyi TaxID=360622 RepID=A0AAD8HEA2_9APIA|nr:hypothetical protein POM88_041461 [Heracleum sosnowskyi]